MKFQSFSKFFAVATALIFLAACGGNSKKETENNSEEFEQAQAELKENVKKVLFEIPSPAEIPFLLEASGADYNGSIINDINKVDAYASMTDKAILNLGIYATDVGYLSSYEKTQESLNYMRSCRKLADKVGLTDSFSPELIEEFEKSVESKDSLATLVHETIADAESLLKEDNRSNDAALMITGSFVEGLYLGTQIVDQYPTDLGEATVNLILSRLIRTLIDQKEPLNDLIAMLNSTKKSDRINSVLEGLAKVKEAYDGVDLDAMIERNEAPSASTIKGITTAVAALRNDLTS